MLSKVKDSEHHLGQRQTLDLGPVVPLLRHRSPPTSPHTTSACLESPRERPGRAGMGHLSTLGRGEDPGVVPTQEG